MKGVLFLLAASLAVTLTLATSSLDDSDWRDFKERFGKSYATPEEEENRKYIFLQSRDRIARHNDRFLAGLERHTQKISKFSDMVSCYCYQAM